jgi:hypothetical protein
MMQESTIFFVVSRLFQPRITPLGAELNPSYYLCYSSGSTKGCMLWTQQMESQTKGLKLFTRCFKLSYNHPILRQHKGNFFRRKLRLSSALTNYSIKGVRFGPLLHVVSGDDYHPSERAHFIVCERLRRRRCQLSPHSFLLLTVDLRLSIMPKRNTLPFLQEKQCR